MDGTLMRYFLLARPKTALAQGIVEAAATAGPIAGPGSLQ
jgi:hypothetical protein